MSLDKVLDEIQDDLLSGDFDAEMKYATHFLHIESLKEISSQELKETTEVFKISVDIYNDLVELSSPAEIVEMIESLTYRLAFYMALSRRIEISYTAAQMIIDKVASGELKPGQPEKTDNKLEELQKQLKRFGKSLDNN